MNDSRGKSGSHLAHLGPRGVDQRREWRNETNETLGTVLPPFLDRWKSRSRLRETQTSTIENNSQEMERKEG